MSVKVAQAQLPREAVLDAGGAVRHLARHELQASAVDLVRFIDPQGLEHRASIHDVSVEKYDVFGSAQVAKPLGRGDTGAAVESVYLIPPLEKEP